MRVAVIGVGKTGLPIAAALSIKGHQVTGVEVNESRLTQLQDPDWSPAEPSCGWEIRRKISFTSQIPEAVAKTDLAIMIVQTPETIVGTGVIDLGPTERASSQLGEALVTSGKKNYTVIMSSTVMPGSSAGTIAPRLGLGHTVIFSPVWIALGSVVQDYLHPPVCVLGIDSPPSNRVLDFFCNTFQTPPIITDTRTAEALKLIYNVWCTLKMAFVNEAAEVFRAVQADPGVVESFFRQGGERPGAFLRPGTPPGGPCFPRDLRFASLLPDGDSSFSSLVKAICVSNDKGLERIASQVVGHLSPANSPAVGIAGLSYKPGVPVLEESTALPLARLLRQRGYQVLGFDTLIKESEQLLEDAGIVLERSPVDFLSKSALIIEMQPGIVPEVLGLNVLRPWGMK